MPDPCYPMTREVRDRSVDEVEVPRVDPWTLMPLNQFSPASASSFISLPTSSCPLPSTIAFLLAGVSPCCQQSQGQCRSSFLLLSSYPDRLPHVFAVIVCAMAAGNCGSGLRCKIYWHLHWVGLAAFTFFSDLGFQFADYIEVSCKSIVWNSFIGVIVVVRILWCPHFTTLFHSP